MKLAVFDIDGTLTLGEGLGTRCFFESLEAMFGAGRAERRIESYVESTDCGIAREAVEKILGRPPDADEFARFKSSYLEMLAREIAAREQPYRPVAGAAQFVTALAARPGWSIAVATGNWRRAAELKLDCARIAAPPVAACSEDGTTRAEVLASAISAAGAREGRRFEKVVYVGDQLWDLRAARQQRVGFLGLASGKRGDALAAEGARIVDNYLDDARLFDLLEESAG